MINDDALVELAKYCARACHVLKDVTQGRDVDSLSGPSRKAIEDLERYVDLLHHSLSTITNDIRTMRNIESVASERRNRVHDLPECHPGSTDDYLIRQRMGLREILRILDVRGREFTNPTISKLPQGNVALDDGHAVSEIKQHVQRSADTETSTDVSTLVRRFLSLYTTPP